MCACLFVSVLMYRTARVIIPQFCAAEMRFFAVWIAYRRYYEDWEQETRFSCNCGCNARSAFGLLLIDRMNAQMLYASWTNVLCVLWCILKSAWPMHRLVRCIIVATCPYRNPRGDVPSATSEWEIDRERTEPHNSSSSSRKARQHLQTVETSTDRRLCDGHTAIVYRPHRTGTDVRTSAHFNIVPSVASTCFPCTTSGHHRMRMLSTGAVVPSHSIATPEDWRHVHKCINFKCEHRHDNHL